MGSSHCYSGQAPVCQAAVLSAWSVRHSCAPAFFQCSVPSDLRSSIWLARHCQETRGWSVCACVWVYAFSEGSSCLLNLYWTSQPRDLEKKKHCFSLHEKYPAWPTSGIRQIGWNDCAEQTHHWMSWSVTVIENVCGIFNPFFGKK